MEFAFREDEVVLLLGEGNFSFCRDLIKWMKQKSGISQPGKFTNVFASCFESETASYINDDVNDFLKAEGVRLLYGVDATQLGQHATIGCTKFDKIIFNFPHVGGKMRIELNRALLSNFFVSATDSLRSGGSVVVSLCEGQGGTPADKPRRYDDTWKVVECGAEGGLVLTAVADWPSWLLSNYRSVGFRGRERAFRNEGALVHTFTPAQPLDRFSVPDNLTGLHPVATAAGVLQVPLAYCRLFCEPNSVHVHVERLVLIHLPFGVARRDDFPLTTTNRVEDSQIQCHLNGDPAYLRTSYEQVIQANETQNSDPFYTTGVVFQELNANFSSYPGSYQMLVSGVEGLAALGPTLAADLGISRTSYSEWCRLLNERTCVVDLTCLAHLIFSEVPSTKALWSPAAQVVTSPDDGATAVSGLSLYPPTFTFDISFSSSGPQSDEPFHNLLHQLADELIQSVALQSRYSPDGSPAVHHCHRLTYRSYERPLHRSAVVDFQRTVLRTACETYLGVIVR